VTAEVTAPPPATARRELGSLVAVIVLAAGAVLLLSSLHWLRLDADRPAPFQALHAEVSGRKEFPALAGLAVVALLIAVLAAVTGTWARRLLGVVLVLTGLGCLGYGIRGLSTPSQSRLRDLIGSSTAIGPGAVRSATTTVLPVLTVVVSVLLVAAGVVLSWRSGRWSTGLSARYEAPALARRVEDPWRSLDRGEDPTAIDR
jgi:Tryptophan-associated transmembrane protein (Trp_oprn_chp)